MTLIVISGLYCRELYRFLLPAKEDISVLRDAAGITSYHHGNFDSFVLANWVCGIADKSMYPKGLPDEQWSMFEQYEVYNDIVQGPINEVIFILYQ